jgi:hypothetical protein
VSGDRTMVLGYEVGSGDVVEIPVLNLAVVGQTQRSGKTTALEALVRRSGVRALTFVTKRGEKSFSDGRRVDPYFHDRADWQFVTSILDATLQEKNKFLRPWIMKICRTTKTLADVQRAVRKALEKATGLNEGVYTQLDAYLDLIVPEIERTRLAESLELGAGLNVMDVSGFATPMQMLFIQSAIDWINLHEQDTIVVIPEAWEFVPEGMGSPVKAAATTLVRKGSGIGNHVWLDSQDMAGVAKVLLRGCPVWLIGVQREANEIKRNLANIPASIKKPTPAAVATLERGQFYACWGTHSIKTYVQPAWMDADEAREIARGGVQLTMPPVKQSTPKETIVDEKEARELRQENANLKRRIDELERFINQPKVGDSIEITKGAEKIMEREIAGPRKEPPGRETAPIAAPASLNGDSEAIYQFVKQRLSAEAPALLRVLTVKPELEVQVSRRVISSDGSSTQGRLARIVAAGFLNETRRFSECLRELERTGLRVNNKSLSQAFKELTNAGFLTKEGEEGYRAVPDMKVRIVEA